MRIQTILLSLLSCCLVASQAMASEVRVSAKVQRATIYVNVPFSFSIEVENADGKVEPDLSPLKDFTVLSQGASSRSQTSRIYDQRGWRTIEHKGVSQNYQLTPHQSGSQLIPALTVKVNGKSYQTQAVTITVNKPQEVAEFKLLLSLNKEKCYVGEALELTVRWLIAADIQGYEFNLPILTDNHFLVYPKEEDRNNNPNLVKIAIGGQQRLARRGSYFYQGKNYTAISCRYTILPRQPGKSRLPASSLTLQALSGDTRPDRSDPFALFARQRFYQTMVIPGNQPQLTVLPLPPKGQPANFTGLVGHYALATLIAPPEANVGDPLRLTTTISGDFVRQVRFEDINLPLAASDFKISTDQAEEESDGDGIKSFTTTIRARHDGITTIPALKLPFFNPTSGKYEEATSEAIGLKIRPTRIITAQDAEGDKKDKTSSQAIAQQEQQESLNGIRHNYETINLHQPNHSNMNWFWPILLLGPSLTLLSFFFSHRHHRPDAHRQQQARAALRALRRDHDRDEAFLAYLAAKLNHKKESLTWHDVEPHLTRLGLQETKRQEVADFFHRLDAVRYGGPEPLDSGPASHSLLTLAQQLDEVLP